MKSPSGRTLAVTAAQRRRAASAKAIEKYPRLYARINRLQEKAKEAFEPHYTTADLCKEIIKVATSWSKKRVLKVRLRQIRKLFEVRSRDGTNEYLIMLRAICPKKVDRRNRSKLAKNVKRGVSRRTKPELV